MRNTEANRTGQRSRRSWRIPSAVEQAGIMGKRPAVPSHDRSPVDPTFELAHELSCRSFLPRRVVRRYPVLKSASASARHPKKDAVNRTFGNVYDDEQRARVCNASISWNVPSRVSRFACFVAIPRLWRARLRVSPALMLFTSAYLKLQG